ncbi:MAG: CBS domain-containing protein [Deltaproteobacteria bacterium]|nr:CBS domain-containing protein [Deltaproteobacteria bacterium]
MTTSPHTIGKDQSLAHAHAILKEHRIRHLPVLDGGALVGMLTERDLALIESLSSVDPSGLHVEDAMTPLPFSVHPDSPLDQVAQEMAEKRYGSAVVVANNKVVGIFTAVDAMTALADLLHTRLR